MTFKDYVTEAKQPDLFAPIKKLDRRYILRPLSSQTFKNLRGELINAGGHGIYDTKKKAYMADSDFFPIEYSNMEDAINWVDWYNNNMLSVEKQIVVGKLNLMPSKEDLKKRRPVKGSRFVVDKITDLKFKVGNNIVEPDYIYGMWDTKAKKYIGDFTGKPYGFNNKKDAEMVVGQYNISAPAIDTQVKKGNIKYAEFVK